MALPFFGIGMKIDLLLTLMAESEEELKSLLMKVKSESEVAQSCPSLRDLMDCSLPVSIHRIFQSRVLEWVAISFSTLVPLPFLNPA